MSEVLHKSPTHGHTNATRTANIHVPFLEKDSLLFGFKYSYLIVITNTNKKTAFEYINCPLQKSKTP